MTSNVERLTRPLLEQACREVRPGARVVRVRHVHGGQSARTSAVQIETPQGGRDWVVLRRFVTDWYDLSRREKAKNEHCALTALDGVHAPRALWLDADGHVFGVPATLQTLIRGQARWTYARHRDGAEQMGRALAAIHAARVPSGLMQTHDRVAPFLASRDRQRALHDAHPSGSLISSALARAGTRPFARRAVLLHGDYHGGNVLWSRSRLAGVVDWETAQVGPAGRDVGYTRMDCTLTGGRTMADAFTVGYGEPPADLWFWELLAAVQAVFFHREWAPAWAEYGLVDLSTRTVRRRVDAFIERALASVPREV